MSEVNTPFNGIQTCSKVSAIGYVIMAFLVVKGVLFSAWSGSNLAADKAQANVE